MLAIEKVEEDDGFNTSAVLAPLKKEKNSLKDKKEQVVNARDKAESKVK